MFDSISNTWNSSGHHRSVRVLVIESNVATTRQQWRSGREHEGRNRGRRRAANTQATNVSYHRSSVERLPRAGVADRQAEGRDGLRLPRGDRQLRRHGPVCRWPAAVCRSRGCGRKLAHLGLGVAMHSPATIGPAVLDFDKALRLWTQYRRPSTSRRRKLNGTRTMKQPKASAIRRRLNPGNYQPCLRRPRLCPVQAEEIRRLESVLADDELLPTSTSLEDQGDGPGRLRQSQRSRGNMEKAVDIQPRDPDMS